MKSTLVVIAITLSPVVPLRAQQPITNRPITKDWITHHLVFSNPGTKEEAIKNGTYDRWLRIVNDPRYIMQQEERSLMASAPSGAPAEVAAPDDGGDDDGQPPEAPAPAYNGPLPHGLAKALIAPPPGPVVPEKKLPSHHRIKKDWSEALTTTSGAAGAAGATTGLGEFPATYEASLGSPSCANDFAAYNTGLAGSSTQASLIAYNNIYPSTSNPTCTGPTVYWAFNTGGTIVNSVAFYAPPGSSDGTGTQMYFVQTVGGVANLTLLKWGSSTCTGTCSISNPASNLTAALSASAYTSCAAPCYWTVALSGNPTDTYSAPYYDPSSDTIYVGDDAGKLHQFTPAFAGPLTETVSTGASVWPAVVNANASLGSPVFYNNGSSSAVLVGDYPIGYNSDCQSYVTSTSAPCGYLYSVPSTGSGTSGTIVRSAQLDYNDGIIDSPILDSAAGMVYIFVGADNNGATITGTVTTSSTTVTWVSGSTFVTGSAWVGLTIAINGAVYTISSVSSTTSLTLTASAGTQSSAVGYSVGTNCGITGGFDVPCAGVYQFEVYPTAFSAGSSGTEAQVGVGSQFMMSGTFDNAYFTSSDPPTGHMYVVGNTGPGNNTLYQVTITSGVMSATSVAGPVVANNYTNGYYASGLQVTEYLNGSTDYIFLSVLAFGNATGCTSPGLTIGCAMGFNVTSGSIGTIESLGVTGAIAEEGGTSGIVVDYDPGTGGNIYFSTLLNTSCTTINTAGPGCAVQTQQSNP